MSGRSVCGAPRDPRLKGRITAPKKTVKPKNAHSVHIGYCSSLSMIISPGLWMDDMEEFTSKFSRTPSSSPFAGLREDLLKSDFNQMSRYKLASLLFTDLFDACTTLSQTGKSALEVTFAVRRSITEGSFPGDSRGLCRSVSEMSLWCPRKPETSEDTKFSMEAFAKAALSKLSLSQKIDSILYVFDVESVYWNLADVKNSIAELVKLIPCHFILFDEPIPTQKSQMVIHMLSNVIVNTVSQLTICRSPLDCVDLSKTLANSLLKKKSKGCSTIQRPNATDFHFGSIRPAQVLVRSIDSADEEYVKPAGAESIELIGFLNSEDRDLNGFGFKRVYQILNAYEESCYKKCLDQYDPKAISHTDSILKLTTDSLDKTESIAFCALKKAKASAEPSYGIVFPHPEDGAKLMLGLLPKGLGSETWADRLTWVSGPREQPLPMEKQKMSSIGLRWSDEMSMTSTTVHVVSRLISVNNVPEFDKFVKGVLDYASVIGHNPNWLKDLLKSQISRTKSKPMSASVLKWITHLQKL